MRRGRNGSWLPWHHPLPRLLPHNGGRAKGGNGFESTEFGRVRVHSRSSAGDLRVPRGHILLRVTRGHLSFSPPHLAGEGVMRRPPWRTRSAEWPLERRLRRLSSGHSSFPASSQPPLARTRRPAHPLPPSRPAPPRPVPPHPSPPPAVPTSASSGGHEPPSKIETRPYIAVPPTSLGPQGERHAPKGARRASAVCPATGARHRDLVRGGAGATATPRARWTSRTSPIPP